ncbi:hypothetical protein C7S16_3244 [Burkholderia thailandensis]|uniref:Uncharacterized protein n=1 Tax=Burkholderia thailandensis TaxID=57975 RepID=A0AAW9D3D8_BURTH|nr:hypothetical protein [Burkholderia thailandensis]
MTQVKRIGNRKRSIDSKRAQTIRDRPSATGRPSNWLFEASRPGRAAGDQRKPSRQTARR